MLGSSAYGGVKEGAKQFKKPSVKRLDNIGGILKNKPVKNLNERVLTAGEAIDDMYKIANEEKKNRTPELIAGALLAAGIANAISNKSVGAPFRTVGSGAKDILTKWPKAAFGKKGRLGRIIFGGLKKHKKDAKRMGLGGARTQQSRQGQGMGSFAEMVLKGTGIGAGVGAGNLAVHMLGDKYLKDKNLVRKSHDAMQEPVSQAYHRRQNRFDKTAAYRRFRNRKHLAKTILKEDIAQNAIKSIPWFTAPIAASRMVNRDLKFDGRKLNNKPGNRIVLDVPNDSIGLNKKASLKAKTLKKGLKFKGSKGAKFHKSMPWKEFFKSELPRSTARSLSWSVPMTALTYSTGRNLRNQGEKLNKRLPDLEPGKTRITIERPNARSNAPTFDSKSASNIIDEMYKES